MPKLLVFGDSFAEFHPDGWVDHLSKKMDATTSVHAVGGSSMEFAFLKLLDSVKLFNSGDIVIFVLTEEERLDLEFNVETDPVTGFFNKIKTALTMPFLQSYQWAVKNEKYIDWYVKNRSKKLLSNKFFLYLSFIQALSLKFKNVKFLVIPAFQTSFKLKNKLFRSLFNQTDNFLLLRTPSLCEISDRDWNFSRKVREQFDRFFQSDPRLNHLTTINTCTLADILYKVITEWDPSCYRSESFTLGTLSQPVSCVEDIYKKFVDAGHLSQRRVTNLLKDEYRV